jgi:hypothetical protein
VLIFPCARLWHHPVATLAAKLSMNPSTLGRWSGCQRLRHEGFDRVQPSGGVQGPDLGLPGQLGRKGYGAAGQVSTCKYVRHSSGVHQRVSREKASETRSSSGRTYRRIFSPK